MTSKKFAGISLLAVFILGFAFGFAVNRIFFTNYGRHPKHYKFYGPNLVEKFTNELDLSNQQKEKLVDLLNEVKKQHREIRKSTYPEYKRVSDEFRKAFAKVLTDEQKLKFLEFNKRYDEKRKR